MGCNSCKNKKTSENQQVFKKEEKPNSIGFILFEYSIRTTMFIIGIILSPLILLFVWYLLFKIIVLNNGSVNLIPLMVSLGHKLGMGNKKYNEDELEEIDLSKPEEYELEEVDKIEL